MYIPILYQDNELVAVCKPNNVLVHHSAMANNQQNERSLIQYLKEQLGHPLYPIHRLDRKTSGVLVFAKQKEQVHVFQELFLSHQIQKTYKGLVRGFTLERGSIDSPVKGRDANVHKPAITHFSTLKQYQIPIAVGPYPTSRYSLIDLQPQTGRLHQLRIHMNKLSHPLIGDPKYGDRFHNRMFAERWNCNKLFLHAASLIFPHPFLAKEIQIIAPCPPHWNLVLTALESLKI
ncbi:pseudouridine synthase [Ochrovirga pacifica]|uniref:pseudouridine synthase n=1 Tax=Ochrovirga pacifica TaxID=1042376 RepID=UPI0002558B03|nr:pseudouridine synthase [Ochrovirga pacifica]